MILPLAVRSLLARPVRSAVLVGGFGLGVAVTAVLLGVGSVILQEAGAPQLRGGGDIVIGGASGELPNARFILSVLDSSDRTGDNRVIAAAPSARAGLYLVDGGTTTPVRARGGIPSLERTLGDPETGGMASWIDTIADRDWASPRPEDVLRDIDRFHAVPDVPARAASWAEWLYFNGRASTARFHLTFPAAPPRPYGRRGLGVRLQLEQAGRMRAYSASGDVDAARLLRDAPDVSVGRNRVRLVGADYHLSLDLPAESGPGRARGELVLGADLGRSLPPLDIRGAGGWVSGYVVPVMSGTLRGSLDVAGRTVDFDGGAGYHDHNWGFWSGVSWQWGQVQHDGLSLVYGRVHPPPDAADASRVPGFIMAIGPGGPLGFATTVVIDESNRPGTDQPQHITVSAHSDSLVVNMDLTVRQTTVTRRQRGALDDGLDFLQLRADYRVTGHAGSRSLDFTAPGSAETFRGR
jgi:hypothetical protein